MLQAATQLTIQHGHHRERGHCARNEGFERQGRRAGKGCQRVDSSTGRWEEERTRLIREARVQGCRLHTRFAMHTRRTLTTARQLDPASGSVVAVTWCCGPPPTCIILSRPGCIPCQLFHLIKHRPTARWDAEGERTGRISRAQLLARPR